MLVPPLAFAQPWDTWIYRGLALLLIGCPCALVISVPASIASALSTGARRGLLMKGGAVIEAASKVSRIAFDKTGTLTHGRPMVTDIVTFGATTEAELLAVAAGVETGSSHPLAIAILNKATEAGVAALPSRDARALMGKGVIATVGDAAAWVTSPRHAMENGGLDDPGLRQATVFEEEGKTAVAVFREKTPLGLIAMRDEPRKDAAEEARLTDEVADAHARADRLGEGAGVHDALGSQLVHRRQLLAAEADLAVRVVLEDQEVVLLGELHELLALGQRKRAASGVLVVGDDVREGRAQAAFKRGAQGGDVDAVVL